MENKILRLTKMFDTFSVEELSNILECDKSEISPHINNLIDNNIIGEIQKGRYAYITPAKKVKTIRTRRTRRPFNSKYLETITDYKTIDPTLLFYDENDIAFYRRAYDPIKERMIKYLQIFNKTYNMNLEEVEVFLKNLKKKYPALRFKISTTVKLRDNFMKFGLRVFDTKAVHQKNYIPDDIYSAFKKLYLYSSRYSRLAAYNELSNMGFDRRLIPCYKVFSDRLKEDYTSSEIDRLRSKSCINPILKAPSLGILDSYNVNANSTKLFKNTAIEFLENLTDKSANCIRKHKNHINKHLMPFFGDLEWNRITRNKLVEFIKFKTEIGNYSYQSIRGYIFTLYAIKRNIVDPKDNIEEFKWLSPDEIKDLHNDIPKLWVISTGFNESELLGLHYEDIDYDNKTITLKNIYMNKKLHKITKSTLYKTIHIPAILFEKLPKNKTGRIFEKVEIDDYKILINTFVVLCIRRNVPFYLISKQLGYEKVKFFYNDYKPLIPKEINADILEGII